MQTFIYEMPVYCGRNKVWRILNLNSGTIYTMDYPNFQEAAEAIKHNEKRAEMTVARVKIWDVVDALNNV